MQTTDTPHRPHVKHFIENFTYLMIRVREKNKLNVAVNLNIKK